MSDQQTPAFRTHNVTLDIWAERAKQDAKWGEQNHHPFLYLNVLMEEVGEASQAALQATFGGKEWSEYREELVQAAAVAMAMIECYDRNGPPEATHE